MRKALLALIALALVAGACGDDDDAGVQVGDVWSRASTGTNGAVYMEITGGDAAVSLTAVSVSPDIASMAMVHETATDANGVMTMSMVSQVEIPAGATVEFAPGGYHVMLMDLVGPLEVGDTFDVTVTFDDGTERTLTAEVRAD